MTSKKESEVVFYAKIGDMSGFTKADYFEEQVQLETSFKNGVKVRVRQTIRDNKTKYELTYKVKAGESNAVTMMGEYDADVDADFFNGFKTVADHQLVKTRFVFKSTSVILTYKGRQLNLPPVKYEVDVYKGADGSYQEWCKIDVEVDELLDYINRTTDIKGFNASFKVSDLAFNPTDVVQEIDNPDLIKMLWENKFRLPL